MAGVKPTSIHQVRAMTQSDLNTNSHPQIMAGPMCTMLLADMGANVIKIERPGTGDDTRRMGSRLTHDIAGGFLALNRNKRSIALDLRSDEGKVVFRRMAETADIVAENFRPGVMDRLGLGYEALAEINPRLVYASISGFGDTGPYRKRNYQNRYTVPPARC